MFLKAIACEVAFREICHCAAHSPNQFDLDFLSQGYHDNPELGIHRIQERIDVVEEGRFDAVLVGYGLCNNMLKGLEARHTPLVIPRAHDCITFFLGSKERYKEYFLEHSGTYYYTAGWLEHRQRGGERPDRKQGAGLGKQRSFEEMVAEYGEENAKYLMEVMEGWTAHYSRGVFIDFPFTRHLPAKDQAKKICQERNWEYAEVEGDLSLLQAWFDGPWPEEAFLVAKPGERIAPSYGDDIVQIEWPR
jgi:hypothetical protein